MSDHLNEEAEYDARAEETMTEFDHCGLPAELLINVFSHCSKETLTQLALCSRHFHSLAIPLLYETVDIQLTALMDIDVAQSIVGDAPDITLWKRELSSHIHEVTIQCSEVLADYNDEEVETPRKSSSKHHGKSPKSYIRGAKYAGEIVEHSFRLPAIRRLCLRDYSCYTAVHPGHFFAPNGCRYICRRDYSCFAVQPLDHTLTPDTSNVTELELERCSLTNQEMERVLRTPKNLKKLRIDDFHRVWDNISARARFDEMLLPLKDTLEEVELAGCLCTSFCHHALGALPIGRTFESFPHLKRLRVPVFALRRADWAQHDSSGQFGLTPCLERLEICYGSTPVASFQEDTHYLPQLRASPNLSHILLVCSGTPSQSMSNVFDQIKGWGSQRGIKVVVKIEAMVLRWTSA